MTNLIPKFARCAVAGAVALAGVLATAPRRPSGSRPSRWRSIVPAGAGGASDQMARVIQSIVTKYQLMKQPMIIQIKGGSSGAEGAMDVQESKGDPHKILVAFSLIYTLPMATGLPLDWRKMNPVAMIAMDEFLLWVNAETPYKTAKQFLDAVKAAPPDTFKMGGTGSKREDHLITFALEKVYGAKFTYIPYKSGGEAATQLVGKHTDSNVNNPSENIAQWRAGQVRALCVFSDQRMVYTEKVTKDQSWAEIPTCKESGVERHLSDAARLLPAARHDGGPGGVLRRPAAQGRRDAGVEGIRRAQRAEGNLPDRRRIHQVPGEGRRLSPAR